MLLTILCVLVAADVVATCFMVEALVNHNRGITYDEHEVDQHDQPADIFVDDPHSWLAKRRTGLPDSGRSNFSEFN